MKRRAFTGVAVAVVAAALAAAATAFFLGTGTTSASAKVGTSPVGLTLSASVDQTALYPGDSAAVTASVTNTAGHGGIHIGTFSGSVSAAGLPVGCLASYFSYVPPASQPSQIVNTTVTGLDAGSIKFNESGTDQSACSGATPSLTLNLN